MIMSMLSGHENIKRQLASLAEHNRIGHAYIFEGVDGIGKTTAAFWFARISMCIENNGSICGRCINCEKSAAGTHPDIIYADDSFINNSKIKANSVDAMRVIKKSVYTKPFMADRKFYIIPSADSLLASAQNSLLKVFEEPPEYCTIILICSNSETLLQTIRSRAVTIRFSPLSDDEMRELPWLKSSENADMIIKLSGGAPGFAKKILNDNELSDEIKKLNRAFFDYLSSDGDMTDILSFLTKDNIDFSLNCLEAGISGIIEKNSLADKSYDYIKVFEALQNTHRKLKINCNFNLTITDMLIKSWEAVHG